MEKEIPDEIEMIKHTGSKYISKTQSPVKNFVMIG